jgi:hypothetical protein
MSRRVWIGAAALLGVAIVFALEVQSQLRDGLAEAAARAEAAERGAAATRERASLEIAEARRAGDLRLQAAQEAARIARTLALIAAASDLRRFDVVARRGDARAQVLWSRANGLAVSGSGLAAAPAGWHYVVWLLTTGRAVPIGPLEVDSNGRATAVLEPRADLPRPITQAMVTLEPTAGPSAPTPPAVLVPAPAPAVP